MTLYELTNSITLQGNIEIKVFDAHGDEEDDRLYPWNDGFCCTCDDAQDIEDLEVSYIFSDRRFDSDGKVSAWVVIELTREEDD